MTATCLPCALAKRLHEDGPHDCNETMAVLNESGAGFDMVTCACPRAGDHPQKTTGPKR